MNTALQQIIVWTLVALAALYSVWRLGGPTFRLRMALRLQRFLPAGSGLSLGLAGYIARQQQPGSGCGTCGVQKKPH